jgi:hypothetical protein
MRLLGDVQYDRRSFAVAADIRRRGLGFNRVSDWTGRG